MCSGLSRLVREQGNVSKQDRTACGLVYEKGNTILVGRRPCGPGIGPNLLEQQ